MSENPQKIDSEKATVRVGILHSLTGTMAIGEKSLKDAELMAIAEINDSGGVLGKIVEAIVEDAQSKPAQFAFKARKLLEIDKVATVFGCWTSASRKAVLPVFEELNSLLWYPLQYEGLESSPNIFYTGLCPKQQVEPALEWLLENKGNKFYLLGSDYVFPRTVNKIIKSELKQQGGTLLNEEYVPLGEKDFNLTIEKIKQWRPDVVFSTINGDSNIAFYRQYKEAGISAAEIPILATSVAEEELQKIGEIAAGHYGSWTYFQELDTPQNIIFVEQFKARYGSDRVTSDPIESAYSQVYLWKLAVEKAGSFDTDKVRQAAINLTYEAPGGLVKIEKNQHLWKHCRIGQIMPNGQFQEVWTTENLIKPQPWLGIEELDSEAVPLAIDMLAEMPLAIQRSCEVEQTSRELAATMAQLKSANQRLQITQDLLLESESRIQRLTKREEMMKRELSSKIHSSLELNTILSTAIEEIRNLLEIDRCKFMWYQPDIETSKFELLHEVCAPHLSPKTPSNSCELSEEAMQAIKILEEAIQEMNSVGPDENFKSFQIDELIEEYLSTLGLTSLMVVPVQINGGEIGVIICEHYTEAYAWSQQEMEMLQDIAEELAIAIDRAKLYERSRLNASFASFQSEQLKKTILDLQKTQSQLIQTEKMSALGKLVAGIAGEINNPIDFIFGNVNYAKYYVKDLIELLQLYQKYYPEIPPEIAEHHEAIELDFFVEYLPNILSSMATGAEKISKIVDSLRNFYSLDEAEMKQVDIHDSIESTLIILQHRFNKSTIYEEITLIKDYGNLPKIQCFAGQLNQVFLNILNNAIDAIESYNVRRSPQEIIENPSTITIRTMVSNPDFVTIKIMDSGSGMTEDVKARLFDPFFTTKPAGKGTGLGLSIAYQIVVEKHGGHILCSSKPEVGTEFEIKIPIGSSRRSLAENPH